MVRNYTFQSQQVKPNKAESGNSSRDLMLELRHVTEQFHRCKDSTARRKASTKLLHTLQRYKEATTDTDSLHQVDIELQQAAERFRKASLVDKQLPYLYCINPCRAFSDAGITLSQAAKARLIQQHPYLKNYQPRIYDAVRRGEKKIPWIQKAEVVQA
jgi:hypothetical protein